jgi:ribosome-binding factor A
MSKPRRPASTSTHRYPRTARLNETLREVIAEELTRIDDERLDLVTITAIDVDPEMNRAIVFFDSLVGEEGDAVILEALGDHRVRLQGSVGRQVRAKKTPILTFKPDDVIRSAEHIQRILASTDTLPPRPPSPDDHLDEQVDDSGSDDPTAADAGSDADAEAERDVEREDDRDAHGVDARSVRADPAPATRPPRIHRHDV